MVVIQGRQGADVLAYSESLEAVSFTSTSPEVWRGLGYWLTYVRDPYAATTTAGLDYMASAKIIAAGFLVVLLAVAGLVLTRWRQRRYAIALVVTGVVLGVGVHPIGDPSPLMNLLLGDGEGGLALALRSSTRAVPVLGLGLALGAATLVDALPAWAGAPRSSPGPVARPTAGRGRRSSSWPLFNLPVAHPTPAWSTRPSSATSTPPTAWTDAAAAARRRAQRLPRARSSPGPSSAPFAGGTPSIRPSRD